MTRESEATALACWTLTSHRQIRQNEWQGNKESNLGMLESKSSALTSLAIPLRNLQLVVTLDDFIVKPNAKPNFILHPAQLATRLEADAVPALVPSSP